MNVPVTDCNDLSQWRPHLKRENEKATTQQSCSKLLKRHKQGHASFPKRGENQNQTRTVQITVYPWWATAAIFLYPSRRPVLPNCYSEIVVATSRYKQIANRAPGERGSSVMVSFYVALRMRPSRNVTADLHILKVSWNRFSLWPTNPWDRSGGKTPSRPPLHCCWLTKCDRGRFWCC